MKKTLLILCAWLLTTAAIAQVNTFKYIKFLPATSALDTPVVNGRISYNPSVNRFSFVEAGSIKHLPSFGGAGEIPFTNSTGDGFSYSPTWKFQSGGIRYNGTGAINFTTVNGTINLTENGSFGVITLDASIGSGQVKLFGKNSGLKLGDGTATGGGTIQFLSDFIIDDQRALGSGRAGIKYSTDPTGGSGVTSLSVMPKAYDDSHLAGKTFTNSPSPSDVPVYNGTNWTFQAPPPTTLANALSVDNSSLEFSSGTTFDGSAAKTISVKAGGVTNSMLAGSIAASKLVGTDIATVGTITAGTWQSIKIGLAYGGTNADLSATGGANQFLKQSSVGAAITVGSLVSGDIPNNAANTTGSAATLTTARTIGITGDVTWTSPSFNGSANVTAAATVTKINGNSVPSGVTTGSLLYGSASNALSLRSIGSSGQALVVSGGLPTWGNVDMTHVTVSVANTVLSITDGFKMTDATNGGTFFTGSDADVGLTTYLYDPDPTHITALISGLKDFSDAIATVQVGNGQVFNYVQGTGGTESVYLQLDIGAHQSVFADGRTGANATGLEYSTDISNNFVDLSMITKGYLLSKAKTFLTKQTFTGATNIAGFNVGGKSSAPTTSLVNGDMYYNTTNNTLNAYVNGVWSTIQVSAPTIFYQTIANNGSSLTQRATFNFTNGLQAVDNSGSSRTDIKLGGAALTSDVSILGGGVNFTVGTSGSRLLTFNTSATGNVTLESTTGDIQFLTNGSGKFFTGTQVVTTGNNSKHTVSDEYVDASTITPTTGFGLQKFIQFDNASGSKILAALQTYEWSNSTAGSESTLYNLFLSSAGSSNSVLSINGEISSGYAKFLGPVSVGGFSSDPSTTGLNNGSIYLNTSTQRIKYLSSGSWINISDDTHLSSGSDNDVQLNNGSGGLAATSNFNWDRTQANYLIGGASGISIRPVSGGTISFADNGGNGVASITNRSFNIVPASGDDASPFNGDLWYNSTTGKFRARQNGATVDLIGLGTVTSIDITNGSNITHSGGPITSSGSITINAIPSGSSTQLQFNNSGAFGGSDKFTVDDSGGNFHVGNSSTDTSPGFYLDGDQGGTDKKLFFIANVDATGTIGTHAHQIAADGLPLYLSAQAQHIYIDTQSGSKYIILKNVPTSSSGLPSGAIWSNSGVLTIVP